MNVVLLKYKWGGQASGGLEKVATRIANAFSEKGAQVEILSSRAPRFLPGFIRLEHFDRTVQNWLKQHTADIVFGMDRNRFQTHLRAGNGVHAAYLKTRSPFCKLNPLHRKILELEKAGFEHPALRKLFVNSHMVKNEVLQFYKTDETKIEVIHNGVEWHEMQSDFDHWENMYKRDVFRFLFVGHGFARKGLEQLLDGLAKLNRRDVHLTVIGKDKNIERFKAKARNLNVTFLGPVKDIRRYYQMADCLVIPSLYDPFANVTVEALAMGLYVLSSKTNGGHEVLTPQNGLVIDDMASALEEALKHSKTAESATAIRESVKHLDFSNQLNKMIHSCIS